MGPYGLSQVIRCCVLPRARLAVGDRATTGQLSNPMGSKSDHLPSPRRVAQNATCADIRTHVWLCCHLLGEIALTPADSGLNSG